MSPTTRKTHRKSRRGCDRCKQRHVKCDEKRPICSLCERLDMVCGYNTSTTTTPVASPTPVPDSSSNAWSRADLVSIHHFVTCGCVGFPSGRRRKLWTVDVVELGFAHEYLLHQILAVGALHRYQQNESIADCAELATRHRAKALQLVQSKLRDTPPDHYVPIFAFAGLTAIYAFGELALSLRDEGESHDCISHIVDCFRLNRGISAIVAAYYTEINLTWARDLINLDSEADLEKLTRSGQTLSHARSLHEMIENVEPDPQYRRIYHETLESCSQCIQVLLWKADDDDCFHLINAWPNKLDEKYLDLLVDKQPIALVILAYFAVLMSLRAALWWFKSWPELLVRQIEKQVGPTWSNALSWPKQMVQTTENDSVMDR